MHVARIKRLVGSRRNRPLNIYKLAALVPNLYVRNASFLGFFRRNRLEDFVNILLVQIGKIAQIGIDFLLQLLGCASRGVAGNDPCLCSAQAPPSRGSASLRGSFPATPPNVPICSIDFQGSRTTSVVSVR